MYAEEKLSSYAIADKFGTTAGTIRKILEMNGIDRRSTSEAKKVWWSQRHAHAKLAEQKEEERKKKNKINTDLPTDMPFEEKVQTLRSRNIRVQDIVQTLKCEPYQIYNIIVKGDYRE